MAPIVNRCAYPLREACGKMTTSTSPINVATAGIALEMAKEDAYKQFDDAFPLDDLGVWRMRDLVIYSMKAACGSASQHEYREHDIRALVEVW